MVFFFFHSFLLTFARPGHEQIPKRFDMDVHHMFTISIAMIWLFCDAPLLDGCLMMPYDAFSTWKDGSFWVWKHVKLVESSMSSMCQASDCPLIFWVFLGEFFILPCSNQSHGSGQSTISPAAFFQWKSPLWISRTCLMMFASPSGITGINSSSTNIPWTIVWESPNKIYTHSLTWIPHIPPISTERHIHCVSIWPKCGGSSHESQVDVSAWWSDSSPFFVDYLIYTWVIYH